MRVRLLLSLLALAGPSLLCQPALAQPSPFIRIDDDRIGKSGIKFQPVKPAQGAAERLRLAGTVVFSGKGLELVSTPAAGVVQAVLVQTMQPVAAGTPVVRLHSPQVLEWQREYVQSRAQLALAADKLKRDQALFDEGIIARSRLEETRSAHSQAQAASQERRQLLRLAGMGDAAIGKLSSAQGLDPEITVVARYAGTVTEQAVTVGQRVDAGAPLLKLARGGELLLDLQASREQADRIAVGDAVQVAGCEKAGRVTAKSLQVNPANQSVPVRASIPGADKCLRANQHVDAAVSIVPSTGIATGGGGFSVPASALLRHEGRDYVLVREPGGVRPVAVAAGGRSGESVVVTAAAGALPAGANVAVQGIAVLKGIWSGLGAAADTGAPK
ncbi:efflux RND transporter periplasmic adaptor subunit [Lacisediminimonas profundi]|uniref:efflux RND transporter periplasmic adaptor subunit n=1 Tax=Lacisediminimonas profundi TaxID=2603856 RepID=UPI0013866DC0|nr:efflux RND transporter periplasmic adaptor subunit [Lacisediminimonas profundi]